MQTTYTKADLQHIFTEALKSSPDQKALLSDIWKKIKEKGDPMNLEFLMLKASYGDEMAAFSVNIACFTYYLLTQDSNTDSYWDQAVKEFEEIVKGYDKESAQAKWGWAILKSADDICTKRGEK